jgi:hypothetical protein
MHVFLTVYLQNNYENFRLEILSISISEEKCLNTFHSQFHTHEIWDNYRQRKRERDFDLIKH